MVSSVDDLTSMVNPLRDFLMAELFDETNFAARDISPQPKHLTVILTVFESAVAAPIENTVKSRGWI
jgi:hypothetical protein